MTDGENILTFCLRHKKNKQPCLDTVSSVTPVLCLFQFLTLLLCLKDSRPFTCCLPRCLCVCIYLKGKCTCVCETDRQAHQNSSPLSVTASIWQWNYFGIWKLNAPHSVKKKTLCQNHLAPQDHGRISATHWANICVMLNMVCTRSPTVSVIDFSHITYCT